MMEPNKKGKVRVQMIAMPSVYPVTIPSDYKFIRNDLWYLLFSTPAYYLFYLVLGVIYFRVIGTHRILGRKKLVPLRKSGFISVANHCHLFDTVLTGSALLPRKPWYASVQRNFEAPYYRNMFRILRGFPIPDGVMGLRKIMNPVSNAVRQGKIVHFFPEEELWHLYQDVDHFQRGAFYLAHLSECPVVPVVHMFRPKLFFGRVLSKSILDITTEIGDPVYPPVPLKPGQMPDSGSVQQMCDQVRQWLKVKLDDFHRR